MTVQQMVVLSALGTSLMLAGMALLAVAGQVARCTSRLGRWQIGVVLGESWIGLHPEAERYLSILQAVERWAYRGLGAMLVLLAFLVFAFLAIEV